MHELTSNRRIAKNTVFLYVRMFITMAVGLYTSRIVLQVLGVVDFGIYNVVGGIVVLLGFLNQTLAVGTQRYITFALGKENILLQRRTFSSVLYLYTLLVIVVFIFAETIGLFVLNYYLTIPDERLLAANIVYQSSIVACVISFFQVPFYASIIAYERMDFYAYVSIIDVFLKLFLVYSLTYIDFDRLIVYSFYITFAQFVSFILYFTYGRMKCCCVLSLKYDKEILRSIAGFCGWNIFGAVSGVLSTQGVNMILNIYFGPACNAARGISVLVNNAATQLSSGFQVAANPQITKNYAKGDYNELFKLVTINSKISFILMAFIIVPFIIEMPYVLKLWLEDFPEDAVLFCRIILLQSLFLSMDRPFVTGIYATGRMKIANLTSGILYLLVFPIAFLLLHYDAPAYSVFIVALVMQPLILLIDILIFRKFTKYKLSLFINSVFVRCSLVFIISFLLTLLTIHTIQAGFVRLLISIFCSFAITSILSFFIGINKNERVKLNAILYKYIHRKNG